MSVFDSSYVLGLRGRRSTLSFRLRLRDGGENPADEIVKFLTMDGNCTSSVYALHSPPFWT